MEAVIINGTEIDLVTINNLTLFIHLKSGKGYEATMKSEEELNGTLEDICLAIQDNKALIISRS